MAKAIYTWQLDPQNSVMPKGVEHALVRWLGCLRDSVVMSFVHKHLRKNRCEGCEGCEGSREASQNSQPWITRATAALPSDKKIGLANGGQNALLSAKSTACFA